MAESDPTPILRDDESGGASGSAERRAHKRDSLFLRMAVATESGEALGQARVRNLSRSGLMADCDGGFRDGDRVMVDLRGIGDVTGRVAWVRADRIGVAFDRPVDPQAARKPVGQGAGDGVPSYLRMLPRVTRFMR
jgi:hypothetical protein